MGRTRLRFRGWVIVALGIFARRLRRRRGGERRGRQRRQQRPDDHRRAGHVRQSRILVFVHAVGGRRRRRRADLRHRRETGLGDVQHGDRRVVGNADARPTSACTAASSCGSRTARRRRRCRRSTSRSWLRRAAPTAPPTISGTPADVDRRRHAVHVHADGERPRRPAADVLDSQSPGVGGIRRGDGPAARHAAEHGDVCRRRDLRQRRASGRAAAVVHDPRDASARESPARRSRACR